MRVLVTGLTSTRRGGMEFHNLGNLVIVDPLFDLLREAFPEAEFATTLQMSEDFYRRHGLIPYREERWWRYNIPTLLRSACDIFLVVSATITRSKRPLLTPLTKVYSSADLIVDFSGDLYGDNSRWGKFVEGNLRLVIALCLKKPVAMIAGSPGPFCSCWRQWVAKRILPRLDLVTNREELSTRMLEYIGIAAPTIHTAACPSVFFEPAAPCDLPDNEDVRGLFKTDAPTVGLIICGWNMPRGPYNRWPREDWEFEPFVKLIQYLIEETHYRVCLMSHQNATNCEGNITKGNDHRLIDRLVDILGGVGSKKGVVALSGFYTAAQSKTLISRFHMLISGRIHGAVQGLSQGIPTAIMEYGHSPIAHKLKGFAEAYGVGRYVLRPNDHAQMIDGVKRMIMDKDRIRDELRVQVPWVKKQAQTNFLMLSELIRKESSH